MGSVVLAGVIGGLAGVAVWALVPAVRVRLIAKGVYDAPNDRSSHAVERPRGGGLAVLAVVMPLWAMTAAVVPLADSLWTVLVCGVGLAGLSFADDVRRLHPVPRLLVQAIAVAAAMVTFDAGPVLQGLVPLWVDRLFAGLAWLWFVNLYNFMDGIDGISGAETVSIGVGLGLVALIGGQGTGTVVLAWVLAGAAAGFLIWNWTPSRIFLGDVGSVGLGYLLGWLLLVTAAKGAWAPALILPGYYLGDATVTLIRRAWRGEKVWHAHRKHAYQQAVRRGWTHAAVVRAIALGNTVLLSLALAVAAIGQLAIGAPVVTMELSAVGAAGLVVGLVMERLYRGRAR